MSQPLYKRINVYENLEHTRTLQRIR